MKILLSIFATLLTAQFAFAANTLHEFRCQTTSSIDDGHKVTKFSFAISNLEQKKPSYFTKDPEDYEPVKMQPADSILLLNENFTVSRTAKGLKLWSDGDGCQFTTVILYADSGFRNGYASVKDGGCGAKEAYATVSCKVSEK